MTAIYVNTVLCAMLFYTCFCRLVRTNRETHASIRAAFVVLATAAAWCLFEPLSKGVAPQNNQLLIEGAMVIVQALTARYWRDSVPTHFQRCDCASNQGGEHET